MPYQLVEKVIDDFQYGVIDTIESKDVPDGASSKSLNWQTFGDKIELRRGSVAIGTESTVPGSILGLRTANRPDGTSVVFRKNGQKCEYFVYGISTDWAECGTNMFGAAGANDDACFEPYNSLSGNQMLVSSPNSGLFKIMVASPSTFINLSADVNYYGLLRMKITQGSMIAWAKNANTTTGGTPDRTGVYRSHIDAQNSYKTITNESIAIGNGTSTTFTGTLNGKVSDPQAHVFALKLTAPTGAPATISSIIKTGTPSSGVFAPFTKITAAAHGLSTGDTVIISGLAASTAGTGTITSTGYGGTLDGSGTQFLTQLSVGSVIVASGFTFSNPLRQQAVATVASISDNTHLTFSGFSYIDAGSGSFTFTNMSQIVNTPLKVSSVIDANNFNVTLDSTNYQPYASGGTVTKTETIVDDYNGRLSSQSGATGTINYTSGAFSLTLTNPATNAQSILATYLYDNSNRGGITDFTSSVPRVAGEGTTFRQDDEGSDMQNSFSYNGHEFCMHKLRSWDLTMPLDDVKFTNLPYRARVGIPYWRAGVATSTGVYYINAIDLNNIKLEKLALNQYSTDIVPSPLSKKVNEERITLGVVLDGYVFDQASMVEFGDLILCACRTSGSAVNNRVIAYNKLTGSIDYLDYTVNCFAIVGSQLWAGDSITGNVYSILYGFADGNANINNSWEGKLDSLNQPGSPELLHIKKCRKLILQGLISIGQSYNLYAQTDAGDYILVGSISGTGNYVDRSQAVSVTIGYGSIGTNDIGGSSDTINAYNYEKAFKLPLGRFVLVRLKIQATGVGYVSLSRERWHDIQVKTLNILKKYS